MDVTLVRMTDSVHGIVCCFARSGIYQHTRIEQAARVEGVFRGFKRCSEQLRTLPIVPWPMVAADRVVVGDRAAGRDELVGRGILDRLPLLDQMTVAA